MIAYHFRGKFWGDPIFDEVPIRNRKPTDGDLDRWILLINRTLIDATTDHQKEMSDSARHSLGIDRLSKGKALGMDGIPDKLAVEKYAPMSLWYQCYGPRIRAWCNGYNLK